MKIFEIGDIVLDISTKTEYIVSQKDMFSGWFRLKNVEHSSMYRIVEGYSKQWINKKDYYLDKKLNTIFKE